ncbi:Trafficking protein particle complex subunit 6B, partial [Grifola frondosa]
LAPTPLPYIQWGKDMAGRESFQGTTGNASFSSLAVAADPLVRQMDGAVMDYFLIEMVNALRESSAAATARAKKVEQEMIEAGLIPAPAPVPPALSMKHTLKDSVASTASRSSIGKAAGDDEEEELRARLEAIGMHVGANTAERLCHDRGLFSDTLDAIKFVCKDLWAACWDKQVDNLRTNHRGVYVLQDNAFKPISRVSGWEGRGESVRRSKLYVAMPAGIIRGALARLGFQAAVVQNVRIFIFARNSASDDRQYVGTFQVKLPKGS